MPQEPIPKARPHPAQAQTESPAERIRRAQADAPAYAELEATSNFTFLTGASHPDELVVAAGMLGHRAVAITDTNTLAGVVRGHVAARDAGMRLVVGCRLVLTDAPGASVLVYPTHLESYGRLCRLLTVGKRRAPKGGCELRAHDLLEHQAGLLAIYVPPPLADERAVETLLGLKRAFNDDRLSVALSRAYAQDDDDRVARAEALAAHAGVPTVVTGAALYHDPARRPLQDVLTCIRERCSIEGAGYRLAANAERHLKDAAEMHRLFADHPRALARTVEVAERTAGFGLEQLRYQYPDEVVPEGKTPQKHLEALTFEGAAGRYPGGVPAKVRAQIDHELALIDGLGYAPYFLTVHDIVAFARGRGILCQGRGAAANSAVCYCLGVTAVDPSRVNMLFERFVSRERDEPPDIDIDFEHERREEVIQYLYSRYGRDRAALTAEVVSFRGKLAIREVGRVMGLSRDVIDRLSKEVSWWDASAAAPEQVRALGLDPDEPRLRQTMALANELVGFPRHLSQHVGGFVITRTPLDRLLPIENAAMADRTVIEWDKDDIEALGMLKVDILGLGMLTCIRKALDLAAQTDGTKLSLATIPAEDPAVYDMICEADTVGVFQIESRAQMSMLPRLRPRCYYDLVIEVAIVRPGPIQGGMVHPYLRRRRGDEEPVYFDETIRRVLGRTLGVPLFQEQAMSLAVEAAGFTPGEADQLRRAIAAWKARGNKLAMYGERIMDGMVARGYPREFAANVFEQIKGFSGYGFPESHAASFALLVYASSWLKRHRPAAFAAALINSQPMGFYQPAQLVRDAQTHGVEVRPIDVNLSDWDCTLETPSAGAAGVTDGNAPALRLGLRLVKGLSQADAERLVRHRSERGPASGVAALWRDAGVSAAALRRLAAADAFGSMGLSRRAALWAVQPLRDERLPLFDEAMAREPALEPTYLPRPSGFAQVSLDYAASGLSLRPHPLSFIREELATMGAATAGSLIDPIATPDGARVSVAGLVLVRQRPETASGVTFMTVEDESGSANLVIWPSVYERCRAAVRHAGAVLCSGRVQREGRVVHVVARSVKPLDLSGFRGVSSRDFH